TPARAKADARRETTAAPARTPARARAAAKCPSSRTSTERASSGLAVRATAGPALFALRAASPRRPGVLLCRAGSRQRSGRQARMRRIPGNTALLPRQLLLALLLSACGAGGMGTGGGGPLTVTVTANGTTLQAGQRVDIIAVVQNSGGNPAVTWALSGATCPDNCGFLANTTLDATTYVAPQYLPANTIVRVTATSDADPTQSDFVDLQLQRSISVSCPSGVDGLLTGNYAFFLRGGGAADSFVAAGSFAADGAGNITSGFYDVNRSGTGPSTGLTFVVGSGLYSIGAHRRGCIAFTDSAGGTLFLRCALSTLDTGVATRGRIIEFDDLYGTGTRAEGFIARQDPASFSTAQIAGSYAFGLAGTNRTGGR